MSKWYAIDALEEAIEKTKNLLLKPFKFDLWLKLTLIVMLSGGLGGGNASRVWDVVSDSGVRNPQILIIAALAFAVIAFIGLIFWYLSAVSRFIYVNALVKKDLKLVDDFKEQGSNGLKIFGFELILLLILIIGFAGAAIAGMMIYESMKSDFPLIAFVVIAVLVAVMGAIILAVIMWLVNDFTVPVIYSRGCGIIEGLDHVKDLIESHFWQFIIYVLLAFALGMIIAIPIFIISFILFMSVFGFLLILGLGAYFGLSALDALTLTPLIMLLIALGLMILIGVQFAVTYIVTFITLPFNVFFRYYSLIFLQKVDPTLTLFKSVDEDDVKASTKEDESLDEKVKVY